MGVAVVSPTAKLVIGVTWAALAVVPRGTTTGRVGHIGSAEQSVQKGSGPMIWQRALNPTSQQTLQTRPVRVLARGVTCGGAGGVGVPGSASVDFISFEEEES